MRQIFTKAQLVVLWISGLLICFVLISHTMEQYGYGSGHIVLAEKRLWIGEILPILIVTMLLIVTFIPRKNKEK